MCSAAGRVLINAIGIHISSELNFSINSMKDTYHTTDFRGLLSANPSPGVMPSAYITIRRRLPARVQTKGVMHAQWFLACAWPNKTYTCCKGLCFVYLFPATSLTHGCGLHTCPVYVCRAHVMT